MSGNALLVAPPSAARWVADTVLARPVMYRALHTATGLRRLHARLLDDVMRRFEDRRSVRVLDLGCGPGDTPQLLGPCGSYLGIDLNPRYVALANRGQTPQRSFAVGDAVRWKATDHASHAVFDVIIAFGLVHHLDDSAADLLLRNVAALLSPRGRFVTLDGCRRPGTSAFVGWLLDHDRGRFVRNEAEYVALFSRHLRIESTSSDASAMHIPYSILSVTARC